VWISNALLTNTPKHNGFLVLNEFKNKNCTQPRRLILYLYTDGNGLPFYRWREDYNNNCDMAGSDMPPTGSFTKRQGEDRYPGETGPTGDIVPQPPLGQWFYDEYFVQYSDGGTSQDRLQYAINGKVIFDYHGPLDTRKPRGIKLTPGYLDIEANVEIQADDLEVYSDIPCANFPCGAPAHY
jgi:hypothetical protein